MTSYDDALRALAASEGIEYVDCRVSQDWESDRPVRHSRLRVVGPPQATEVTAGVGLGADVPAPALPILLRSPFEQLVLDPAYRKAADKGLKIHEAALARAEEKGIPYSQALEEIT